MIGSMDTRSVIDAHTHVHPDAATFLLEVMEANGIDRVVNMGILERLGIPFREGMRAFQRVLGERLVYLSTPDFGDTAPGFGERMAEELARKVEAGACGLKIFKELLIHTADPVAFFQPLTPDNERWEELQLHPDWHFGRPEFPDHDTLLAQRNRVLERHPGTTFIGAHLGNYPEDLAYVAACLERTPNFSVDTSARIGEFGRHPVDQVRSFFVGYQDRIVFGTDLVLGWDAFAEEQEGVTGLKSFYDAHWRYFETGARQIEDPFYPIHGHWHVDALDLPEEVLDKLYMRNAQRLIPGLCQ
jgi:hypothetical protein